jgi:hypothetical protein
MVAGRTPLALAFVSFTAAALVAPDLGAETPVYGSLGNLELSLSVSYLTSTEGLRASHALVALSIPLGRVATRSPELSVPRAFAQPPGPEPEQAPEPEADREPTAKAPAPSYVPALTPELARRTVRAALRVGGSGRARTRLDSLESRARSSAALPELSLRAARSTDESLRLTPTIDDPYRYSQAGGTSLLFEARLGWKLDRLVFADEELGVERLRGERARAEVRLVERVLVLLFAWERARAARADPDLGEAERLLAELEILKAEVSLDLLTGGWFTSRARSAGSEAMARERSGSSKSRRAAVRARPQAVETTKTAPERPAKAGPPLVKARASE